MTTYNEINCAWPDPMPVPTPREAVHGTKRLLRHMFALASAEGIACDYGRYVKGRRFKVTSGRRYTWCRRGTWMVNPNGRHFGGWQDIVHCISHWAHRRFWPGEKPHGVRHVWIERELTAYAIEHMSRWAVATAGEKIKPDPKAVRAASVAARLKTWERKKARAETALRKLRRQARYYGLETNC